MPKPNPKPTPSVDEPLSATEIGALYDKIEDDGMKMQLSRRLTRLAGRTD